MRYWMADEKEHDQRRSSGKERNHAYQRPAVRFFGHTQDHPTRALQAGPWGAVCNAYHRFVLGIVAKAPCRNPNGVGTAGQQLHTAMECGLKGVQLVNIGLKADPVRIKCRIAFRAVGSNKQISGQNDYYRHENREYEMRHLHQLQ